VGNAQAEAGMRSSSFVAAVVVACAAIPQTANAVASAELYRKQAYVYGRFEARIRFGAGDGVISSFFLWKEGSEVANTFWNELDFEKLGADCHMQTNAIYGNPQTEHSQTNKMPGDICSEYHDYRFEWTPTYIAWVVDGQEIRRETGATATAFSQNATSGMTFHFNVWPGNANFGGNFSPSILPVREHISWVSYSSYNNGAFKLEWREDFTGNSLPSGWATGDWASPYSLSVHNPSNVTFANGVATLSLTADNALGFSGNPPADNAGSGGASLGGTGSGGAAAGGTDNRGGSAPSKGGAASGGAGDRGGNASSVGGSSTGGAGNRGGTTAIGTTSAARSGGASNSTSREPSSSGGAASRGGAGGASGSLTGGNPSSGGSSEGVAKSSTSSTHRASGGSALRDSGGTTSTSARTTSKQAGIGGSSSLKTQAPSLPEDKTASDKLPDDSGCACRISPPSANLASRATGRHRTPDGVFGLLGLMTLLGAALGRRVPRSRRNGVRC